MSNLVLAFPSEEMELKAIDFKQEFFDNGEHIIPGSYKWDMNHYNYSDWLQMIKDNLIEATVNPKFGVSQTYFAIDEGKIIGIINFRHILTDFYKDSGHIGYSVRPTERKKGYATEILKKVLEIAKKLEFSEVYLVCNKNNEASRKTIQKNRGILNRTFVCNDIEKEEYRINLQ